MLGGGVGRLQGFYGLISDNVCKVCMVLWNGIVIEVLEKVNKDLFWVVCGVGQNFGVVIEIIFQIYFVVNGGMYYEVNLVFSVDKVKKIIDDMNVFVLFFVLLFLILVGSVDFSIFEVSIYLQVVILDERLVLICL